MSDNQTPSPDADLDLTSCDREPIHILGKVQGFGCLIAVSADWMITHASRNTQEILGFDAEGLVGRGFADVFPRETVHDLRTRMQILSYQPGAARIFCYKVFGDDRAFDVSISQQDARIVLEFEPRRDAHGALADGATVQALIARVTRHTTLEEMAQEATRGLKLLSGFDRVMVYKFNEDDSGSVIAESAGPGQEAFLGLHYPASDIPKQARALYTKNLMRIISNVQGDIFDIIPENDPHGDPLDLSLTITRAVSPIHLEYLRNMGVEASMSISILRNGKLWGLFACHNDAPRHVPYEARSQIELFAQLFNYELSQLEMTAELAELDAARSLHDQLMARLSGGQNIAEAFERVSDSINEVIPFDGAVVYSEGNFSAFGVTPTKEQFLELVRFLNTTPAGQVYATQTLADRFCEAKPYRDQVAGILALPVSRRPRDYLVLFRKEIAASVHWAGNPDKPVVTGPEGARLTPRKSFALWKEVVRGKSAPWRSSELRAADALRVTLLEVVLKLSDERNEAQKRAQNQQELLIAELNHRVRNILNLIRALVSQGEGDTISTSDFRTVLDARIFALARAHDQLTDKEWSWAPLRAMIETELKAFVTEKTSRVSFVGEDIELSPAGFTTMALVIHELVTNSAKYGALVDSHGSVRIEVSFTPDGMVRILWQERDGPPVQSPTRRGFGTTIIERSVPFELKGTAELRYKIPGIEAEFHLPPNHARRSDILAPDFSPEAAPPGGEVRLQGQCLLVEDNMVIALDASHMLMELGADFVHSASRANDALELIAAHKPAFVMLDLNLGDHTSLPLARKCADKNIPFIIATGYGASADLVAELPDAPILKKPYDMDKLKAAISQLELGA